MFENFRTFETDFAGRPLVIETGKMAQLANGECLVRYGETVVHVAVTASAKPREGVDFFPLSVDFEEKLYAVGKIPGSFLKREGRPSDKAILTSRVIDRPIRPLFPQGYAQRCIGCLHGDERRPRLPAGNRCHGGYLHRADYLRYSVERPDFGCIGRNDRRRIYHQPDGRAA